VIGGEKKLFKFPNSPIAPGLFRAYGTDYQIIAFFDFFFSWFSYLCVSGLPGEGTAANLAMKTLQTTHQASTRQQFSIMPL